MFTRTLNGGASSGSEYGYVSTSKRYPTHDGADTQEETTTYTATKDTTINLYTTLANKFNWLAYIIFYINDVEVGRIENPVGTGNDYYARHNAIFNIKTGDVFKVTIKSYATSIGNNYFDAYVAP